MRVTNTRFLSGLSTVGLAMLISSVASRLLLDTGTAIEVAAGRGDQRFPSHCPGYRYSSVAQSGTRGALVGALLGGPHGAVAGAGLASIAGGIHQAWSITSCVSADVIASARS